MLEVLILYSFYIPASLVFNLGWIGGGFHPACWKFTKAFGEHWPRLFLVHGHLSALEIKQNWLILYHWIFEVPFIGRTRPVLIYSVDCWLGSGCTLCTLKFLYFVNEFLMEICVFVYNSAKDFMLINYYRGSPNRKVVPKAKSKPETSQSKL